MRLEIAIGLAIVVILVMGTLLVRALGRRTGHEIPGGIGPDGPPSGAGGEGAGVF